MFSVTQAKEIVGIRITQLGWQRKEKLRVINDLTFGGGANVRKGRGTRKWEAYMETKGRSLNADTDQSHNRDQHVNSRIMVEVWGTGANSASKGT